MKYDTLALETKGENILVVKLNRPEVLNALNTQMGRDQLDLWTRLSAEPGSLRCVVLTGRARPAVRPYIFCPSSVLQRSRGLQGRGSFFWGIILT